jgi:hypothetical protein
MAIRKTGSADDQQLETDPQDGIEKVSSVGEWGPGLESALADENTDADS